MTVYCLICKKESIPGDKSRSFHSFPKNHELKEKWIRNIGRETVKKHAKICSDHFDPSSFHPKNGYNNLKTKLISGAVPRIINQEAECIENIGSDLYIGEDQTNFSENDPPLIIDSEYIIDDNGLYNMTDERICDSPESNVSSCAKSLHSNNVLFDTEASNVSNLSKSFISDHTYTMSELNHAEEECTIQTEDHDHCLENNPNLNGKLSESSDEPLSGDNKSDFTDENDPNTSNSFKLKNVDWSIVKKYRFFKGNQLCYMSRVDFTSDDAWNRFLEFVNFKNKQIKSLKQKCNRTKQKVINLKALYNGLKIHKNSNSNRR